jgi:hypothetical protein
VAVQPGIAATERTTRTPCGERTATAADPATESVASSIRRIDAPTVDRPGSASRLNMARAKWLTNTVNEPSCPASPHCGAVSASCSWPFATNTAPPASVTDGAPRRDGSPPACPITAMAVTGRRRSIVSTDALAARAGNQRVDPPGISRPIRIPASFLASASGTSSLDTVSDVPKFQVVRSCAAMSRPPVPGGPGGAVDPLEVIRYAGTVSSTDVSS